MAQQTTLKDDVINTFKVLEKSKFIVYLSNYTHNDVLLYDSDKDYFEYNMDEIINMYKNSYDEKYLDLYLEYTSSFHNCDDFQISFCKEFSTKKSILTFLNKLTNIGDRNKLRLNKNYFKRIFKKFDGSFELQFFTPIIGTFTIGNYNITNNIFEFSNNEEYNSIENAIRFINNNQNILSELSRIYTYYDKNVNYYFKYTNNYSHTELIEIFSRSKIL